MDNYYEILDVSETATPEEIKKSYRNLSKKHHPDVGGDEGEFKKISEAYDTLSSQDKKAQYDHSRKFGGNQFGSMHSQMQEMQRQHMQEMYNQMNRGPDISMTIKVTLEEVLSGKNEKISYTRRNTASGGMQQVSETVTIPSGVQNGQMLTARGKGHESRVVGAYSGDLLINIVVILHPEFSVERFNLIKDMYIPFHKMALGGEIEVPTLEGKNVKFNINAGTKSGSVFSLKGKGLPVGLNSPQRGNVLVSLHVKVPESLSDTEVEKLNEIKDNNLFT